MILQETVLVQPTYQNIPYYEGLGYSIIRVLKYNKIVVPRTKILVQIKDLPKGSPIKIHCKCDKCGKERIVRYNDYSDLCLHCSHSSKEFKQKLSGKNNGMFGKLGKQHPVFGKIGMIGNQNPMWNTDLTNEERLLGRNRNYFPRYSYWIKQIHKKGKCEICNSIKELRAHHLNNWSKFKNQRVDIKNGVCLCKDCHNLFHFIFGKYCTKKDFELFIKMIIP